MTAGPVYGNTQIALSGLVPLRILELRGTSFEQRRELVAGAAELIGSRADEMMFASHRKSSGVFSTLVGAFAVLAFQPGGVTALGVHACAFPHPWCPAVLARPGCCTCDPEVCGATRPGGECADVERCGWCSNGCPAAETGAGCCGPVHPAGRFVIVHERVAS
jgi:hypothetical protein